MTLPQEGRPGEGRLHTRVAMGPGGEFDLIRRLIGAEVSLPRDVVVGSGDDCTVLEGGWVISTDLSVEGVHFRREWISLEEAGFRATAGALSDLAAMAAGPVGTLISLALDPSRVQDDAEAVQAGAEAACEEAGAPILGGDLARSPGPLFLSLTVIGRTTSVVSRAGTRAGDDLWVTGHLGASAGAVALWQVGQPPSPPLREAFVAPRPRIREALWLADRASLHGLIDLSDGLGGDAGHLAAAAGLSLILQEDRIPVHPALYDAFPASATRLNLALSGGEDYELCFTTPPGALDDWVAPFQDTFGIPLTKVGWAAPGTGVFLEGGDEGRRPVSRGGFDHFAGEETG